MIDAKNICGLLLNEGEVEEVLAKPLFNSEQCKYNNI